MAIIVPAYFIKLGTATIFYVLYLYWWHEFISTILDGIYFKEENKTLFKNFISKPVWGRIFVLFMYLIFILVVFGYVIVWNNSSQIVLNVKVLFWGNLFFNLNLVGILLNEIWLRHYQLTSTTKSNDPFSGRMLVLHIALIFGGIIYFIIANKFPHLIATNNDWKNVFIILPFLILKVILDWRRSIKY